jgi:preprotein translocase subunit SecG
MGALLLVRWTVDVAAAYKLTDFVNQRNKLEASVCGGSHAWLATLPRVYTFLAVIQVIISGILIFLILLHSGKDAGLSGAFGIGGGGSSFGGGSMVERNLDRATVFFAILFVVNTIVLLKI